MRAGEADSPRSENCSRWPNFVLLVGFLILQVVPDCLELLLAVTIERREGGLALVVGVAGHLCVWGDPGGIGHPAVEEALSQAALGLIEIDPHDFEGCAGFLRSYSVACGAPEADF